MKKSIRAFVLAAATAAVVASGYAPAEAASGREVGAFLGGLVVGGAISANRPPYVAAPVYVQPRPVYVQPAPVYVQPVCRWQNRRFWDPYIGAYVIRRERVCG
jgi:hypothetical protein